MKLKAVKSIGELFTLAQKDERYAKLAMAAASNLGGDAKTLTEARRWLETNASEGAGGERGVVKEINFCRDLVDAPAKPEKKAPSVIFKQTTGRAPFIHGLRESGVSKSDALKQTQEKFKCPSSLFDRIWKRNALGQGEEKPERKSQAKTPPAKKTAKGQAES